MGDGGREGGTGDGEKGGRQVTPLRPKHSAYNSSVFKQCYNELSDPSTVKNVSSAYWPIRNSVFSFYTFNVVLAFIPSASSSTHIKNKYGDSGSPCLTPLSTGKNVDR